MIVDLRTSLLIATILVVLKPNNSIFVTPATFLFPSTVHNALHHYNVTTNEIPYHVLIVYHGLYCSGALVRSKVVVTAASCFFRWQGQRIVVKVGADTVTGIGQVIEAAEIKRHEYFGHSSMLDNDIAVVMLKEHVNFDLGRKIMMMEADKPIPVGSVIDVSGYADQHPPKFANNLLWSEMSLVSPDTCLAIYPGLNTRSNFCVKYGSERGLRDNGGPAVYKDLLVGILSYGAASDAEPYMALLTNVSYFHKWITLNSMRFMMKYCVEPVEVEEATDLETEEY